MAADRIPAWIPIAIAGGAVVAFAVCFVRPALDEADAFASEADGLEHVASRHTSATRGLEKARAELDALEAFSATSSSVSRADVVVLRVGTFDELLPLIEAIDEAPRSCVRRVDLESLEDGRVKLEALVDPRLARILNVSGGWTQ